MAEITVDGAAISCKAQSPNSRDDRDGEPPRFIVLHSTGGAFAGAVRWLMNAFSPTKASAHFVVSRVGVIAQLVSIFRVAFHAGTCNYAGRTNMNSCSLGIEMEHYDRKQDWPREQVVKVAHLCAVLAKQFAIHPSHIVGHKDICWPRGRKIDPYDFPWADFRAEFTRHYTTLK